MSGKVSTWFLFSVRGGEFARRLSDDRRSLCPMRKVKSSPNPGIGGNFVIETPGGDETYKAVTWGTGNADAMRLGIVETAEFFVPSDREVAFESAIIQCVDRPVRMETANLSGLNEEPEFSANRHVSIKRADSDR
jgi:hypothetical protein